MNYKEAKTECSRREEAYKQYCKDNNLSTLEAQVEAFKTQPVDICNVNNVRRVPYMLLGESSNGVYEYPAGLMACSGIPKEAFLSEEELNQDHFYIHSYNDDFEW